ncbi:pcc1 [Coprinopsis cinerea okayama7|uniref:Pcc1 n=2 Tax=Coprinopsis cinerea TaxID=5346 RepID=A8N6M1_COPC7|nr:pcc1 [Coprinopsis cinerea okayama7\|eukprot:XP_001830477.1 pcc1 [Coprinopsis cinerea okayama7\
MAGPVRTPAMAETRATIAQTSTVTPPRPPNAWILYRGDKLRELFEPVPGQPRMSQADVSRIIGQMWRTESDATRMEYERRADEAKAEHAIKYPNYRFNPKKKEEKEFLRAQRKEAKEREKAQAKQLKRQQARAQSQQQVAQPVQPSVSTTPMAYPPAPVLLPHPSMVFYPPMMGGTVYYPMELFGTAGPSPPVSLASSPAASSTPESTSASEDTTEPQPQQPSPQPPISALPYPFPTAPRTNSANPYLALLGPAATRGQYMAPSIPPPPATTPASAPTPLPQDAEPSQPSLQLDVPQQNFLANSNSDFTNTPLMPTLSMPDNAAPTQDIENFAQPSGPSLTELLQQPLHQETLQFDVNADFFAMAASMHELQDPNAFDASNFDPAALSGEVFSLNNFTPDMLNADPSGELVVNFGSYGQPEPQSQPFDLDEFLNACVVESLSQDPPAYGDPNMNNMGQYLGGSQEVPGVEESQPKSRMPAMSQSDSPSTSSLPSVPPTPSPLQPALSVDLSNTQQPAQKTPYVPPSGAALASTRRVGGSWKPPPICNDESLDHYRSSTVPV